MIVPVPFTFPTDGLAGVIFGLLCIGLTVARLIRGDKARSAPLDLGKMR